MDLIRQFTPSLSRPPSHRSLNINQPISHPPANEMKGNWKNRKDVPRRENNFHSILYNPILVQQTTSFTFAGEIINPVKRLIVLWGFRWQHSLWFASFACLYILSFVVTGKSVELPQSVSSSAPELRSLTAELHFLKDVSVPLLVLYLCRVPEEEDEKGEEIGRSKWIFLNKKKKSKKPFHSHLGLFYTTRKKVKGINYRADLCWQGPSLKHIEK